jgi:hypothetical protein
MFLSAITSLLSTVIVFGVLSRSLHAIDLVGRGGIRIGVAIGGQASRIGERHRGNLRRLRATGGAAQRAAGAKLVRRRF